MKTPIHIGLAVAVLLAATTVWAGPDNVAAARDKSATQVAYAWFASLMRGKTAVTTSLSAVPFSFDRKMEVKTYAELKALYDRIVHEKGKRDLTPTSAKIESSPAEKVEVVLMIEMRSILSSVPNAVEPCLPVRDRTQTGALSRL